LNTDYSELQLATSSEEGLQYATKAEYLLGPLRNGVRMSLAGAPDIAVVGGPAAASGNDSGRYSRTTVQVAGVDEADLVNYDGDACYEIQPDRTVLHWPAQFVPNPKPTALMS
jgi:uncharacterized secreted protein with C-terminal beta-propeller domain